jgi:hypothetical protein
LSVSCRLDDEHGEVHLQVVVPGVEFADDPHVGSFAARRGLTEDAVLRPLLDSTS